MELTASSIAILLQGGIKGHHGKTGLAFLRYSQTNIVAIIDSEAVGESLLELTKIDRPVPIVSNVADSLAYKPDVLLIGIAPSGGRLPTELQAEIETAISQQVYQLLMACILPSNRNFLTLNPSSQFGTSAKSQRG